MRTIGWCLVLTLATPARSAPVSFVETPPPPESASLTSSVVEVPMDLSTGRPVVSVMLGDKGPYDFILDTGASSTVIDAELATELQFEVVGKTQAGDPTHPHSIESNLVKIPKLSMGGVQLSGLACGTMGVRKMLGKRYGGILGLPDLGAFLVTLDYPHARVRATQGELRADDARAVEYTPDHGLVTLPMTVAGQAVTAHLDSGNPGTFMLPKSQSDKWKLKAPPVEVGVAGTVSNRTTIARAQVDGEIRVGGLTWSDPEVSVSDLIVDRANIGFDALQDVAITVDQKNHRIVMERSATPGAPRPTRRRLGLQFASAPSPTGGLQFKDGGLEVERVFPGSPSDKAGIQKGDRIVSVNGKAIVEFDPDMLSQTFGGHDPLKLEMRRGTETLVITVE